MRYTECRMERIAGELLADIDMETVDFTPNYDESTFEPTVLPTRIPNLIVNGSSGIAVGMATNILRTTSLSDQRHHRTGEESQRRLLECSSRARAGFPHRRLLYGKSASPRPTRPPRTLHDARPRGHGEPDQGTAGHHCHRDSLPVNKSKLIERVAELVNEKIIDDIGDVRDESDRDGMRIVIELKRGAQPEIVLNQLYKHTQMQESFSMIFLAVLNGQPRELPLDDAIRAFINHRVDVVQRRTVFLLRKAREFEHIREGYKIASR